MESSQCKECCCNHNNIMFTEQCVKLAVDKSCRLVYGDSLLPFILDDFRFYVKETIASKPMRRVWMIEHSRRSIFNVSLLTVCVKSASKSHAHST